MPPHSSWRLESIRKSGERGDRDFLDFLTPILQLPPHLEELLVSGSLSLHGMKTKDLPSTVPHCSGFSFISFMGPTSSPSPNNPCLLSGVFSPILPPTWINGCWTLLHRLISTLSKVSHSSQGYTLTQCHISPSSSLNHLPLPTIMLRGDPRGYPPNMLIPSCLPPTSIP